ncbi:hypothetical protein D3C81_1500640 [compost metagenome]
MPPLAAWKKPPRSLSAPVKAPLTWPKNSDSISVSGMAPQLTAINGCEARALIAWMARAARSLPLPDSPLMTTGAMLRASRESERRTSCMAAEWPGSKAAARSAAASAPALPPASASVLSRCWRPSALSTRVRSWSSETGLAM